MDQYDLHRININGDLSTTGVLEQYPPLVQHIAKLAGAVPAGTDQYQNYEIDLTGVQTLDACGCQLLAAFLHDLRQRGVDATSLKLSDAHRETIHLFGFDYEIFAGERP